MHVMNMLHGWKTKIVGGKSVTASCSRRSACSSISPIVLFLHVHVLTHAPQYDRVDPTEFQLLKDEIEGLKAEKSTWEAERATHASLSTEQQEKVIIANQISHSWGETYVEDSHRLTLWRR